MLGQFCLSCIRQPRVERSIAELYGQFDVTFVATHSMGVPEQTEGDRFEFGEAASAGELEASSAQAIVSSACSVHNAARVRPRRASTLLLPSKFGTSSASSSAARAKSSS